MAYDFPNSPTIGQIYQGYSWDGEKWTKTTTGGAAYTSDTPPPPPIVNGSLWYETDTGYIYVWSANQWNVVTPPAPAPPDLSKYVLKAGDTMTGPLVLSRASGADELVFQNASDGTRKTFRMAASGVLEYVNNAYTAVIESHDDGGNVRLSGGLGATRAALNGAIPGWPLAVKTGSDQNMGFYDAGGGYTGIGSINDAQNAWQGVLTTSSWTFQSNISVGGTVSTNALSATGGVTFLQNQGGTISQGGAGAFMVQSAGGGNQPMITFHMAGAYAGNFGMDSAGNFYCGGWSFGAGNAYKFWTSRDFAAPNFAPYVSNGRLSLAGDQYAPNTGLAEPYGGGVITGWQGNGVSPGTGIVYFRFRVMQLLTTGWFTIGYIG